MKKLVIEFSNERLITPSGLSLVGQLLGKSKVKVVSMKYPLCLQDTGILRKLSKIILAGLKE